MPEIEQQVHSAIMLGLVAYIELLALPFVPGAEIGRAMLTTFGAAIAPLVYVATVLAMLLSYTIGQPVPIIALARLLSLLRKRRAAEVVTRASLLSFDERLAMLLNGKAFRLRRD